LFSRYRSFVLSIKQPRHEVNHSHASSGEVKNERSYTCAPPVFVYGMDRWGGGGELYLDGNGILFLALSNPARSFQVGINPSHVAEMTNSFLQAMFEFLSSLFTH
jgi:hypothetical protein